LKLLDPQSRRARFLSLLLTILVPFSLVGADLRTAMLYGKGDVKINGNSAGNSAALYSGDKVLTAANATATITSAGTVITLDENTDLSFETNKIKFSQGHAVVSTTKGVVAHFANLSVSPTGDRAKFAVVHGKGTYQLAALTGPLTISDGTHTAVLEAGSAVTRSDAPQSQEPAPPEPKSKRKTGVFAIPGWQWAVVGAAGAGAGYGIYRAVTGDPHSSVSPQR
jgi:hypothetical protein